MFVKKNTTVMLMLIVALVALMGGLYVSNHINNKKAINLAAFHGTYLEHPRIVNSFTLTGTDNKIFDNQALQGRWTMVFFGFTSCGYLCPTTMAEIGKMYKILEQQGVKNLPQVVMITLDPKRDSLAKVKDYVESFDPHFYGARGETKVLKQMTREMGVMYAKVSMQDKADPKAYDIQHSGTVILFNPEGKLNAFFTTPHRADILAKDYRSLLE